MEHNPSNSTFSGTASGGPPPIVVNIPPPPPPPRRSVVGSFLRFVIWFVIFPLWLLSLGIASTRLRPEQALTEEYHSLNRDAKDKIVILSIEGTLLTDEGFIKQQIDRVQVDKQVVGIVIRVDSPGGTITASDGIYHRLRKLREEKKVPMVVSMGGIAASGGYYVSMAVGGGPKTIYAEPTTWTGSIGVIIPHYDLSGLMEVLRIDEDSIASGPLKGMGNPTKKLTQEEREILQGLVDESFARFKDVIGQGRPFFATEEGKRKLGELATGQVFTATQARNHGLVDEVGYLEEAIARAVELANRSSKDVKVVRFRRPMSLWSLALTASREPPRLDARTILELATPRAYYLYTLGPVLMGTRP